MKRIFFKSYRQESWKLEEALGPKEKKLEVRTSSRLSIYEKIGMETSG
jgi:hypothetical protein